MPVLFEIRSASATYRVISERDAFRNCANAIRSAVVIADTYFANDLLARGISAIAVDANERTKSLESLGVVIVRMREAGASRDTQLWAIGGGTIQDVAAFVASIYMRGIAWTYMPTTLLGMVDSCIGGKSSLNVDSYKNIIGTFHAPSAVIIDAALTATLSIEQRIGGLAEAAKICYCRGAETFKEYLALRPNIHLSPAEFEPIISLSLSAKKWFVEIDEFDRAERLLLNLGHTFGHALEGASGYRLSHGVAVGVGMLCSLELSRQLLHRAPGGPAMSFDAHVLTLLRELPELPGALATIDVATTFDRMKADKKHESEHYRFITFDDSGRVQVTRHQKNENIQRMVTSGLRKTLERLSQ